MVEVVREDGKRYTASTLRGAFAIADDIQANCRIYHEGVTFHRVEDCWKVMTNTQSNPNQGVLNV